ncbi:hypothetical protein R5W23_006369 [Gemmata sp. JC673]|uniref:HEAT repeat domain-containing protein n=1 Tax=Gemmata algarum TaxID=2975278 RepID=A0ABU5EZP9_9BACT|nr:hypothetical protein [Gemmata algarum]MDY3559166.1 hypothetical protein [Gemmata algarum]
MSRFKAITVAIYLLISQTDNISNAGSMELAAKPLTAAQQVQVRRAVYDKGPTYTRPDEGPFQGKRILTLPPDLVACYQANPVETLRLLTEVVRGGAPKDAVLAAAYGEALAGDPVVAALVTSLPLEYIDRPGPDAPRSARPRLMESAQKHLSEAEKREKGRSNKKD